MCHCVLDPPCLQCHSYWCTSGCEFVVVVVEGRAGGAHWQPCFRQPAPGQLWLQIIVYRQQSVNAWSMNNVSIVSALSVRLSRKATNKLWLVSKICCDWLKLILICKTIENVSLKSVFIGFTESGFWSWSRSLKNKKQKNDNRSNQKMDKSISRTCSFTVELIPAG